MKKASTEHPFTTDLDISSLSFWNQDYTDRERTWKQLREEAPVSWHPAVEVPYEHDETGFWAVAKAADISEISKDEESFSSAIGGVALDPPPAGQEGAGASFQVTDGQEHTRLRNLVSAAFTPKQVRRITDQINENAREIVDGIIGAGEFDFVERCAAILPTRTVSDMVGISPEDRAAFARSAELIVGRFDSEVVGQRDPAELVMEAAITLYSMGTDLAEYRRENPGDDLMTNLVQAEINGEKLSDEDIGSFMLLFAVAGNDTTKQTTSHGLINLKRHPKQQAWLMEDFDGRIMGATNEMVRYVSPVQEFTRTVTREMDFRGQRFAAGDKVAMFYCSGNMDSDIFDEPERFDLSREKNPHVGFGGGGVHYCLGNGVAKTQLKAIFGELLTRVPDIEIVGEPERLENNFINGITRLPVRAS